MFNALAYSKELERAGFSREQAEATINVFFKFMEYNFATKTDLTEANYDLKSSMTQLRVELKKEMNDLRTELKAEMNELRIELKTEISDIRYQISALENKMTIKFGLMQAATIGILAAIIKLI